ncbi:MAG: hypothetical protein IPK69_07255 [Phycisphaerales bacterium]|nr:MAG: hypothetical protein IPK69_07255 [Phycisphaerales bacterium]
MTPNIPEWIRTKEIKGYKNIFDHDMCPSESHLFGTEDLYGDWDGHVLLLAKDFGPSCLIHKRRAASQPLYVHSPSMKTNKMLKRAIEPIRSSRFSCDCGFLYGSAAVCMLRDDEVVSGNLPNRSEVMRFGAKVLNDFVVPHMRNLQVIVCLGRDAWDCCAKAFGTNDDWASLRTQDRPWTATRSGTRLLATKHPAFSTNSMMDQLRHTIASLLANPILDAA